MADTRLSRLTRLEFSPRKAAGDLDFWGGALLEVESVRDAFSPLMLKASEAPSITEDGLLVCFKPILFVSLAALLPSLPYKEIFFITFAGFLLLNILTGGKFTNGKTMNFFSNTIKRCRGAR